MRIGDEEEKSQHSDGDVPAQRPDGPPLGGKDILAVILALFQLFTPLVLALAVVGALVGVVLHFLH